jgi:hypothetical protein
MEQWAAGQFQHDTDESTSILNAGALGEVNCYRRLADLELHQFNEVLGNDDDE